MTEIKKEDYLEPVCPFCTDTYTKAPDDPISRIPVDRVTEKLEEYLSRDDQKAALRHLNYWLSEAEVNRDRQGELALRNERMGYFRKNGKKEEAFYEADRAGELLKILSLEDSLTGATTKLNMATVYNAFGEAGRALPLYEKAEKLYEALLKPDDARLGGLYNNYALALVREKRFEKAQAFFERALEVMKRVPDGELEAAVTHLNLCDLLTAQKGQEEAEEGIMEHLERAEALLKTPSLPHNGYYAFVLSKCAPGFGYYGWFAMEKECREEAKRIYERA